VARFGLQAICVLYGASHIELGVFQLFRALFRRGYSIVRYAFRSKWHSNRRPKAVDRNLRPVTSALPEALWGGPTSQSAGLEERRNGGSESDAV
jgi:hypothetical protein